MVRAVGFEQYKVKGLKPGDFAPPDHQEILTLQSIGENMYCLQLHQIEGLRTGSILDITRALYLSPLHPDDELIVEIATVALTRIICPNEELTFFVEIFYTDNGTAYQHARTASDGLQVLQNSVQETIARRRGKPHLFGLRTVLLLRLGKDSKRDTVQEVGKHTHEPQAAVPRACAAVVEQAAPPMADKPYGFVRTKRQRWRSFRATCKKVFSLRNIGRTTGFAEAVAAAFNRCDPTIGSS